MKSSITYKLVECIAKKTANHLAILKPLLFGVCLASFGVVTKVTEVVAVSDYRYDNGEIKLVALETEIISGEIKLTVHDKIKWLRPTEILELKLAPADIAIAQSLC